MLHIRKLNEVDLALIMATMKLGGSTMLGNKIIELRKSRNLSQEQLADLLNVSRQTISRWEQDTVFPTLENCIELCRIFDININNLLEGEIEIKDPSELKLLKKKSNLLIIVMVCLVVMIVTLIYKNAQLSQKLSSTSDLLEVYQKIDETVTVINDKVKAEFIKEYKVEVIEKPIEEYDGLTDLKITLIPNRVIKDQVIRVYTQYYVNGLNKVFLAEAELQDDNTYIATMKDIDVTHKLIMLNADRVYDNFTMTQYLGEYYVAEQFSPIIIYYGQLIYGDEGDYFHIESKEFPLELDSYKNWSNFNVIFDMYYNGELLDSISVEYDVSKIKETQNRFVASANFDWNLKDARYKNTGDITFEISFECFKINDEGNVYMFGSGYNNYSYNEIIQNKYEVLNYYGKAS